MANPLEAPQNTKSCYTILYKRVQDVQIEHVSEQVELSYLNNLKRAKFLNIYNSRTENLKELIMGEP